MLRVLAAVIVIGGVSMWQSRQTRQTFLDQAVVKKRSEIAFRKQLEKSALATKQRAGRAAERAEIDADARAERLKWTMEIEAATLAMRHESV